MGMSLIALWWLVAMLDGSRAALAQLADQPTCRPRESRAARLVVGSSWMIQSAHCRRRRCSGTWIPIRARRWRKPQRRRRHSGRVVGQILAVHDCRAQLASHLWRPCRRRRSAAGSPRRRVFGDVYGGHLHSRHDVKQTYTLGSGGLVHAGGRDMPRDARRSHGRTGRRPPDHCPAGPPMHLTATGTVERRAIVLILHDGSQPATTVTHTWTPQGLCQAAPQR